MLHLAQGLRERGAWTAIATQRPGWLTERAAAAGVPVWLEAQSHGWDPGFVLRFARRLRSERIGLLHAHEFAMGVYGGFAARLVGLPAWATLHGRSWVAGRPLRRRAYRALHAIGVRVATVSSDLADYLATATGIPRAEIAVVENGVVVSPRRSPEEVEVLRSERRAELGARQDAPLLVAVGNLYPVKDHATLLRAVAPLDGVHLAIAGRGGERDRLATLARELGASPRVHLLGLRSDVDEWLAAADLFVHPSLSEELPLAVLEAMAAERAVVATRVGGVPDAVVHGETGRLVPPGDPAALGGAIRELLGDPARRAAFGRAARARVEARFGVARMLERHAALYDEALGTAR